MREPFSMRTERLELRALTTTDSPFLHELYADPEVSRFIGAEGLTADVVRRQAERFAGVWEQHGYGQSVVLDRATGEAIGRVGLHPWEEWGELELGWVLARSHQGRGLAAEAARAWMGWAWMGWARQARVAAYLTAVIHPDNAPSIRLAERLGFAFDRHDETPWSPALVHRLNLG